MRIYAYLHLRVSFVSVSIQLSSNQSITMKCPLVMVDTTIFTRIDVQGGWMVGKMDKHGYKQWKVEFESEDIDLCCG